MQYEPTVEYIPFNINQGNLPSLLTEFELSEISTSYKRSDWVHLESTVPILVILNRPEYFGDSLS